MEERANRKLRAGARMSRITVVYDEGRHPFKLATGRKLLVGPGDARR